MKKEENLIHAFRAFDKDQDGFISVKELKEFFHGIGELTLTDQDAKEMIQANDVNKVWSLLDYFSGFFFQLSIIPHQKYLSLYSFSANPYSSWSRTIKGFLSYFVIFKGPKLCRKRYPLNYRGTRTLTSAALLGSRTLSVAKKKTE